MLRLGPPGRKQSSMRQTSRRASKRRIVAASALVLSLTGCGWLGRQAIIAYLAIDSQAAPKHVSIVVGRSFIEQYQNRVTIRTAFTVDKAMSVPLPPPLDGDLHVAGRAPQVALPIVAEIANAGEQKAAVELANRAAAVHARLRVSGVWRILPEHGGAKPEGQGKPPPAFENDNPDHVFEIHPVMSMERLSLLHSIQAVHRFTS